MTAAGGGLCMTSNVRFFNERCPIGALSLSKGVEVTLYSAALRIGPACPPQARLAGHIKERSVKIDGLPATLLGGVGAVLGFKQEP